jgi:hypothetical protein
MRCHTTQAIRGRVRLHASLLPSTLHRVLQRMQLGACLHMRPHPGSRHRPDPLTPGAGPLQNGGLPF